MLFVKLFPETSWKSCTRFLLIFPYYWVSSLPLLNTFENPSLYFTHFLCGSAAILQTVPEVISLKNRAVI